MGEVAVLAVFARVVLANVGSPGRGIVVGQAPLFHLLSAEDSSHFVLLAALQSAIVAFVELPSLFEISVVTEPHFFEQDCSCVLGPLEVGSVANVEGVALLAKHPPSFLGLVFSLLSEGDVDPA